MRPIPFLLLPALLLAATTARAEAPPPGRLLASNCFQCHGTNGKSGAFERLAGMSEGELFEEMKELQGEDSSREIMARHANGYSDEQIRLIARWFASQPRK